MKGLLLGLFLAPLFLTVLSTPLGIFDAVNNDFYDVRSPVGDCPPRDTNETIYLIDNANCSIYYVCSNGIAYLKECPPDMYFNPDIQICDWSIDVICKDGNRTAEDLIKTSADVDQFGTLRFVDIASPFTAVGSCPPRDTNETVYLKDDRNCSIYYICSNGRPIQVSCPPDMSFNPVLNICDWEVDVQCRSSAAKTLRRPVGTCPEKDPPLPVFLPDDSSCLYYYECSGGIPILNECPPELEFNPIKNVCDFPLDAGCKATGSSTEGPVETTSTDITDSTPPNDGETTPPV